MGRSRFTLSEMSLGRIRGALVRRVRDMGARLAWTFSAEGKANRERLAAMRDRHRGERCVIICSGPSLARTPMELVQGERTIAMNRAYLMFDQWGFVPTYLAAINANVLEQFAEHLRALPMPKFVDFAYRDMLPASDEFLYLRLPPTLTDPFGRDLTHPVATGGTVTYASLQIAYHLGFRNIIIIGMDHNFTAKGTPNTTEVRKAEVDRDHVHPDYFPKGLKWDLPDLRRSELAYAEARKAFEADGGRIVDATVDGKCRVFERMDLKDALSAL